MTQDKDFDLVKHFMFHLVTGGGMFLAAGAVSAVLELAANYLDDFRKLWLLAIVFHVVSIVILVLDVGSLVFFLLIRTYRFIRDTWSMKDG